MSASAAGGPAVGPAAANPAEAPVALDRVMLAMDVVDTLRHQRDLVERELDGERRQRELIARVQALYESQGIDVPAEVVAEGVAALEQDRFVYTPPPRTFAVRLAEICVERGRWAKYGLVVLLLLGTLWAAIAVPSHLQRRALVDRYTADVARVEAAVTERLRDGRSLEAAFARLAGEALVAPQDQLLELAERHLANGLGRAEAAQAALQALPAGDAYADAQPRGDAALAGCRREVESAQDELAAAQRGLQAIERHRELVARFAAARGRVAAAQPAAADQPRLDAAASAVAAALQTTDVGAAEAALTAFVAQIDRLLAGRQRQAELQARLAAATAVLAGVDVEPAAQGELDTLRSNVGAALVAGDSQGAAERLEQLEALVAVLDRSYQLRIVSRPEDRSGVWRYQDDRSKRNYYIIVEAVDARGAVLTLPILDEEKQKVRKVRRFGVRVPFEVYERVRADKMDNNLIDDVVFGSKRRGAREPEFRFPVAGGFLTEW